MIFGQSVDIKWCFLHRFASLDCCCCVFSARCFFQLFHLFHGFQRRVVRPRQRRYRSFPCFLMHLAMLFHAKSMAKCRTLHGFFMQIAALNAAFCLYFARKHGLKGKNGVLDAATSTPLPCNNLMREWIICGRRANRGARGLP